MASGTVKWFNPTKGYGFIQPDSGGGKDVFVHISAVEAAGLSTLNEGQKVEYEIISDRGKEFRRQTQGQVSSTDNAGSGNSLIDCAALRDSDRRWRDHREGR